MLIQNMYWEIAPDMRHMTGAWLTYTINKLIQEAFRVHGSVPDGVAPWSPFELVMNDTASSDSDGLERSSLTHVNAVAWEWARLAREVGEENLPDGRSGVGAFMNHLLSAELYDAIQLLGTATLLLQVMHITLSAHIELVSRVAGAPSPLSSAHMLRRMLHHLHKLSGIAATQRHVDRDSHMKHPWARAGAADRRRVRRPGRGRFHCPSILSSSELSDHDKIYLFSLLYNINRRIRTKEPLNTFHTRVSVLTVPFLIQLICNSTAAIDDLHELIVGYLTVQDVTQLRLVAHEVSLRPNGGTQPFLQLRRSVDAIATASADFDRLQTQTALCMKRNMLASRRLVASRVTALDLS